MKEPSSVVMSNKYLISIYSPVNNELLMLI